MLGHWPASLEYHFRKLAIVNSAPLKCKSSTTQECLSQGCGAIPLNRNQQER